MGARWRQVARQGLWASLTGGCFLDPHLGPFANCFHLYAWLFLLALPLLLYTMLPPGPGVLGLYCGLVAAFFGAVKAVNFRLHAALDRGTQPDGDPHPLEDEGGDEGGAAALLGDRGGEEGNGHTRPPGGALELTELRRPPPAPCSSQPSLCGFNQLSELLPQLEEPTDLQQLLWQRGSTNVIVTAADRHRLRRDPPGGTGGCPPPAADVPPASGVPEPPRGGGGSGGGTPGTASTPLDTPSPWGGAGELSLASSPSSPSSSSLSAEALPPPAPPPRWPPLAKADLEAPPPPAGGGQERGEGGWGGGEPRGGRW